MAAWSMGRRLPYEFVLTPAYSRTRSCPRRRAIFRRGGGPDLWTAFFASTPSARFEVEESFVSADRAVQRGVFRWHGPNGAGHVRGVDLFRVRDGKVAEKLSYVKS